jgi:hypothetical protein
MKLCTTGNCAACCVNADCPANVECNGGACNECLPGYGTCSALCDTNLTTSKNCGTCGKVCTVNNLLCLATGAFCGCKGDASAGYSCT